MNRFYQMQVFTAVAEEEGFAAAARRLNLSPPAVTRAVSSLEEELGVKLLKRTTRFVRMTEAGARYLQDAKRILAEVEAADEAASGIHCEPRGHLTVTAPVLFGKLFVMPGIVDYLHRYPEVTVDAVFLDRVVNLLDEGVDVGVRIGELPDSNMRALRVGTVRNILVAAPDYLAHHGWPQTPRDLLDHTIIASSAGNFSENWRFQSDGGESTVKVKARLTVTTNDAAIEAAEAGLGITRVLSYQAASHLAEARLNILLPEYEPAALPVQIVHLEGWNVPAKVRTFIDLLASRLRADQTFN